MSESHNPAHRRQRIDPWSHWTNVAMASWESWVTSVITPPLPAPGAAILVPAEPAPQRKAGRAGEPRRKRAA